MIFSYITFITKCNFAINYIYYIYYYNNNNNNNLFQTKMFSCGERRILKLFVDINAATCNQCNQRHTGHI